MLIAGASGHAMELLQVIIASGYEGDICFYDDVHLNTEIILGRYRVLHSADEAISYFAQGSKNFALGVGKPTARKLLAEKLTAAGGTMVSVVAMNASVGRQQVNLGTGLNIMPFSVITTHSTIGAGTLLHIHTSIHHDTEIGAYCELSPGSRILGGAKLGDLVSVGTNAVIMPRVVIGEGATIGAGAVVTRNVPAGATVKGIPAK